MSQFCKRLLVLLLFIGVFECVGNSPKDSKILRCVFPFKHLKKDPTLIDPANTVSIYEYYLLENLGVGLIRDDVSDPRGYKGVLSSHWEQVSPTHWSFTLREGIKWSDGTDITPHEVVERFQTLKTTKSRHLLNLSRLKKVEFDPKSNSVNFYFRESTNDSFLHELSLADAVLVSPRNLTQDWKVTSGPYFVSKYITDAKTLELTANSFSPLASAESPGKVLLFDLPESSTSELFKTIDADIYSIAVLPFSKERKDLIARAPSHTFGQPTLIYYWEFNPENPLTKDLSARKELASLTAEVFKSFSVGKDVAYYSQLVSKGYSGVLDSFEVKGTDTNRLQGQEILLRFRPPFKYLTTEIEELKAAAVKRGIKLVVAFDAFTPEEKADTREFARLQGFKGNQKDSVGSWSFLFSGKGALSPFKEPSEKYLNEVLDSVADAQKSQALLKLHRFVLENAFVVPFLVQTEHIMTSKRINLTRWNPFDLRLRFYDVAWQ